ncbi:ATP-binding protein [Haladaptatus sp. NG-SE-30]
MIRWPWESRREERELEEREPRENEEHKGEIREDQKQDQVEWTVPPALTRSDQPYRDSYEHLLDELSRIDYLLWLRVEQWRAEMGESAQEFAGYYIPDEKVDRLLWPGANGWGGSDPVSSGVLYEEQFEYITRLTEQIEKRKRLTLEQGTELRLATLADRFDLDRPALDVLLVAVAPEFDSKYETVYAYLHDDLNRKRPSVDLVLRTFSPVAVERLVDRELFAPTATLRRNGLIRLSGGEETALPTQSIVVDERIVDYLLGTDAIDDSLSEFIEVKDHGWQPETLLNRTTKLAYSSPDKRLEELILDTDVKVQLKNLSHQEEPSYGGETTSAPLMAHFYGPYGAGRLVAVAALNSKRGRELLIADVRGLLTNGIRAIVEVLIREARLRDADICISNLESLDEESDADVATLLGAFDEFNGRVYLLGKEPMKTRQRLGVDTHTFIGTHFPIPSYDRRLELWSVVDGLPADVSIPDLAGKFRLTGGQIADAVETAKSRSYGSELTADDIYAGCRAQSREKLSTLGRIVDPTYEWDDIVLPEDTESHLREVAAHIKYQGRVYSDWGFKQKFSLGNGVIALFTGASGTGKTMAAEIIANDAGLDLYKIDLSNVVSKYIGETEKNLSEVFDEAENSNAILFFDEADALFGKRSEVSDAHDRYANIEVNYLLQRVEEHDGAVILTTNFKQNIDEAFMRRIHLRVDFPLPDRTAREKIWRGIFPKPDTLLGQLDYEFLSTFELTGGNIKNIALTAAFLAVSGRRTDETEAMYSAERRTIRELIPEQATTKGELTFDFLDRVEMEHIIWATRREFQKTGKLIKPEMFGEYHDLVKYNP